MLWPDFDARFTMRGHQLSEVKSLIDSAQYQNAYTQARLSGYSPDSIANYVNTTYGTKWTGADLAKSYEATAQASISAQGYAFDRAGFTNGAFNGAPFRLQDFINTVPPGGSPIGLASIPVVKLSDYVASSNPAWAAQARAQIAADQERAAGSTAVIGPN